MIRCLITGQLFGDPQARTSQAGKAFTTAKVRADGKDGKVSAGGPPALSRITGHSRRAISLGIGV